MSSKSTHRASRVGVAFEDSDKHFSTTCVSSAVSSTCSSSQLCTDGVPCPAEEDAPPRRVPPATPWGPATPRILKRGRPTPLRWAGWEGWPRRAPDCEPSACTSGESLGVSTGEAGPEQLSASSSSTMPSPAAHPPAPSSSASSPKPPPPPHHSVYCRMLAKRDAKIAPTPPPAKPPPFPTTTPGGYTGPDINQEWNQIISHPCLATADLHCA